jgi:hypothetical protein
MPPTLLTAPLPPTTQMAGKNEENKETEFVFGKPSVLTATVKKTTAVNSDLFKSPPVVHKKFRSTTLTIPITGFKNVPTSLSFTLGNGCTVPRKAKEFPKQPNY